MLEYLILTSRTLLMVTVVVAAIIGYSRMAANKWQARIVYILTGLGTVFSIVIAILRNATNKVDSAILNGWVYAISIVTFLLYIIFSLSVLQKKDNKVLGFLPWVFLGIESMCAITYGVPEAWGYPYHIWLNERTFLSTDFLLGIIGWLLAIILMIVLFLGVEKSIRCISVRISKWFILALLLISNMVKASGFISVLFQKAIIKQNHVLFTYTVFVKNHADYFTFLVLLIAIIMSVMLWIDSFKQNEPYRNPAEHRKIKAKWRRIRRWSGAVVIAVVLGVCNLTVVEAMNATDVTLSPIEDATAIDDENVYVAFDLVNDGHLHRFAYTSDAGVEIRFIVIQKSTGNSYGVGLDACDVCGETGYYEKDGQVVCNLCDVVMNISTIGFKGGCNPIVIPYEIKNGQIIVPISGLLEYESEFK